VVTIGTFDGVHMGHKKILKRLIQSAKELHCESLVLTFFPHPRMVLQESSEVKLLNTMNEKNSLLQDMGIDNLIIHPFDKEFSRLTAEEFVKDILIDQLNIQKIIIGHDHRFGRNRTADINDLIAFGKEYHFEVEQISVQEINENAVILA
jgi:riboflavin kinase/FMN adenylyltransferase